MKIAETERLALRELTLHDSAALEAVFCDAEVMRFSDGVRTPEGVREWVGDMVADRYPSWGFGMWAVLEKRTDQMIGYCGLSQFPDRAGTELGFRLARQYWGRGFATEAATAARDHGLVTIQLPRIVALIDPANLAAVRVVEKIGMRYDRDIMLPAYTHPDSVFVVERPTKD